MKVSNVNPVISKIKSNPKLENIKNFTAENKKLIGATTAMAGLMGLAIYAAAAIKPTAVTPDIYNEYVKNHKEPVKTEYEYVNPKAAEAEENLNNTKEKLNQAKIDLNKDIEQQKFLEAMLNIPEVYDREYYQQQYDILKDFIKMGQENVEILTQEVEAAQNDYKKATKRY